jgi:hypothetical protein
MEEMETEEDRQEMETEEDRQEQKREGPWTLGCEIWPGTLS